MTCVHGTDRYERYVLRKLQRGLTAIEARFEQWNIKINEDKIQASYFCHRRGPVAVHLTLKGENIPFVKEVKYLGEIFHRKIKWRCHTEMIAMKALRTFIRIYAFRKLSD
jgi:hypothetical protein